MILDIDPKGNKISLSATQADLGKNESNFECKVEGDELKIAFSCTDKDFLLEIANHLNVKYYINERKKLSIIYTLWIENK
jgi:hypothetical protein